MLSQQRDQNKRNHLQRKNTTRSQEEDRQTKEGVWGREFGSVWLSVWAISSRYPSFVVVHSLRRQYIFFFLSFSRVRSVGHRCVQPFSLIFFFFHFPDNFNQSLSYDPVCPYAPRPCSEISGIWSGDQQTKEPNYCMNDLISHLPLFSGREERDQSKSRWRTNDALCCKKEINPRQPAICRFSFDTERRVWDFHSMCLPLFFELPLVGLNDVLGPWPVVKERKKKTARKKKKKCCATN